MTSILIARLPPHSKSSKAIEFMQENDFVYRITSNSPLANLLTSSGGVEDRLAQIMGLCEEFKPGKEEIQIVKELIKEEIDENLQERGDPIVQPGNKENEPVEKERSISEAVEVKEEVDSDGMEGVVDTKTAEPPKENVAVIIQPSITDSPMIQTLSTAVHSKNSEEVAQNLSSQQPSAIKAIYARAADDILENVDAGKSMMSFDLLHNDDLISFDASSDGDLLETMVYSKNESVGEFDEEEEKKYEEKQNSDVDDDMTKEEKEGSDEEKDRDDEEDVSSDEEDEGTHEEQRTRKETPGSSTGRLLFTCPIRNCISSYKKIEELEEHMESHNETQEFHCDVCKKSFSSKQTALKHIQERKKKECCGCGKQWRNVQDLVRHFRSHTGEKPFICATCGKGFSASSNLKTHVLHTHKGVKRFPCSFCKQRCTSKHDLKKHERTHTGEKPYKCNHCDYRCVGTSYLRRHNRTHTGEKPFSCGHCEKRFTRGNYLKIHEMTHTGEKPYKCKQCDCEERFAYKHHLKSHELTHTGEKPFKCTECGKGFAERRKLNLHIRTLHTDKKPFETTQGAHEE